MQEKPKVKSLYKAVKLLDHFTAEHPERGVKELAELTGMLKSSVYNIMSTYQMCGFIEKGHSGKYRLGRKILQLSNILYNNDDVQQVAKPYMDELAEEFQETVYLAKPSETEVVYIDSSNPKDKMYTRLIVGVKAEMYCTGIGKAMLASMDPDVLEKVLLTERRQYTPNTIVTADALRQEMIDTRERGYAIDNMEHEYGIRCVGVSIRNFQGEVVAAMSISGPSLRMTDERLHYFAQRLLAAAGRMRLLIK